MHRAAYERPAIVELGTLHERTLTWMVGAGGGFGGYASKHNASVRKFGSFTIMGSDDSDNSDNSYTQVKSSGSKSKHSGGSGGGSSAGKSSDGGGGSHGGSGHGGFNVSDVFKGFGGSH